jgi:hypothetical protein
MIIIIVVVIHYYYCYYYDYWSKPGLGMFDILK